MVSLTCFKSFCTLGSECKVLSTRPDQPPPASLVSKYAPLAQDFISNHTGLLSQNVLAQNLCPYHSLQLACFLTFARFIPFHSLRFSPPTRLIKPSCCSSLSLPIGSFPGSNQFGHNYQCQCLFNIYLPPGTCKFCEGETRTT